MGMGTTADRIQRRERRIDEALKESFPASDPPFFVGSGALRPEKHSQDVAQNIAQNIAVDDPGQKPIQKPNIGKKPARKKR
jgi:hypothetical protein